MSQAFLGFIKNIFTKETNTELSRQALVSHTREISHFSHNVLLPSSTATELSLSSSEKIITPDEFFQAARDGNSAILRLYVRQGNDVNIANEYGCTAIHIAAVKGRSDAIRVLLELRVDVNQADKEGFAPIASAALGGHADTIYVLHKLGANVNQLFFENAYTVAHIAASQGHSDAIRMLHKLGADVKKANKKGLTPIHIATENGKSDAILVLHGLGADIQECDEDGFGLLHVAADGGHSDAIRLLHKLGAKVDQPNKYGVTPAHVAARMGHSDTIRVLQELGADVKKVTQEGRTLVSHAAEGGHADTIRLLHELGVDVKKADGHGCTPAHFAAEFGHADVIRVLYELGVDMNQPDQEGFTPIQLAAQMGHTNVIRILKDLGADVNQANNLGFTPISTAAGCGQLDAMQVLLELKADIHEASKEGFTPLHSAAEGGHSNVIRLLKQLGANLDQPNSYGATPLHLAAAFGHSETIHVLKELGADVKQIDKDGRTLVSYAAEGGHSSTIGMLHALGVDVKKADKNGLTPVHWAAMHGHADAIRVLQLGVDIQQALPDENGNTPLAIAASLGHLNVIQTLVDLRVDVNATVGAHGWTVAQIAAQEGQSDAIRLLKKLGANLEKTKEDGATPAHVAADNGQTDTVRVLNELRANINARDKNLSTPLHLAAQNGHIQVVKCLLKCKADVFVRNKLGTTPLINAELGGHKEIATLLEEHIKSYPNGDVALLNLKRTVPFIPRGTLSAKNALPRPPQRIRANPTVVTFLAGKQPASTAIHPAPPLWRGTTPNQTPSAQKPPQKNPRKEAETTQTAEIKRLQEQVKLLQKAALTPQVHLHTDNEAVAVLTQDVLAKMQVLQNSSVSPEAMKELQDNVPFINWLAGNEAVMTKLINKGWTELENEETVKHLKQDPSLRKFHETICMQFMSLFSAAKLYGYVSYKPSAIAKTADNLDIVLRGASGCSKWIGEIINFPLISAGLKAGGKVLDEIYKDMVKKTFKSIYQFYKGDTASLENFIQKLASAITLKYQQQIIDVDPGQNGIGRLVDFILQKFIFYILEKLLKVEDSANQENTDAVIQLIIEQLGIEKVKTFSIGGREFEVPFAAFYVAQKGSRFASTEDPSIKAKLDNLWKDSVFKLGIDSEGLISAVDILSNKGKILSPVLEHHAPLSNPSGTAPQSSSTYQGRSLGSLFDKEGQNIRDELQKRQKTREAIKKILTAISKTDKPIVVSDDMQKYFSAVLSAKLNELLLKYYLLGKGHHLVTQEINASQEIIVTEFKDKASNVTLTLDAKNAALIIAYPAFATFINDDDVLYMQSELNRFIQEQIAIIISPYAATLNYLRPESVQVLALFCARRICAALEYAAEYTDDLATRIKTGNALIPDIKQVFKKEGKSPEIFPIEGETSSAKTFLQSHATFRANLSSTTTTMVEQAPSPVLTPEMAQLFMAFAQKIQHLETQVSVLKANAQPPADGIEIEIPEIENPQFAQLITNFTSIYSPPLQAVPGSATPHVPALQPRLSPSPI
jgi:ankyrin repeat protein